MGRGQCVERAAFHLKLRVGVMDMGLAREKRCAHGVVGAVSLTKGWEDGLLEGATLAGTLGM